MNEYTTATNTKPMSASDIMRGIENVRKQFEQIPKSDCDVFLLTEEEFDELKKHVRCCSEDPTARLSGLPIEVYPTREDCMHRAVVLYLGYQKRPGMIGYAADTTSARQWFWPVVFIVALFVGTAGAVWWVLETIGGG